MHKPPKELTTIRDFLRFATSRFNAAKLYFGHGTDNAWDEATALVLPSLHLPYTIDSAILDAHLTSEERQMLMDLIVQRVEKRMPAAYLTHEAWFFNLPFYVDERVLIPRSPIAELIENHFEPWIDAERVQRILDLCTGSGCIAVACAKAFPAAHIDASDISRDALAVTEINILRHEVAAQVTLHSSDLFATLTPTQYDIIVSNPPYVSTEEMLTLPKEYQHEPALALAADDKGLSVVVRILCDALPYLHPTGILVIEVGNSAVELTTLFPHVPFVWMEFQRGHSEVLLLTAEQVATYQQDFRHQLQARYS